MYYHFAFVAISVTMFGMAVGALLVFLRPQTFVRDRTHRHLALAASAFAITIVLSYLTHLAIPFVLESSLVTIYAIVFTYVALSVPFIASGIVVSLALTRFPAQVSALYAADLAGAAAGCLVVGPMLSFTDAPTAVLATAAVSAIAAVLFFRRTALKGPADEPGHEAPAYREPQASAYREPEAPAYRGHKAPAYEPERGPALYGPAGLAIALAIVTAVHGIAARHNAAWLRLVWVKGQYEARPIVEKWNSFSRVRVVGDPGKVVKPSGWGLSVALPADRRARELHLDIDSYAGTELTAFHGDPSEVEHLKYDVTNVVHYLRPGSRVVVVGTGGGRDILSALAFGQAGVTGVEINGGILDLVNRRFGDFTGHLDRDPRVRFVNDEARSYIVRSPERADIIQISLIDTWAATASGAFVLTENSLYTVEAWRAFLEHLTPRGILSVSRWYYADRPGEVYRLASLASTTLMEMGVGRPGDHYAIVRARPAGAPNAPDGIGTMLVSRDPLSAADLDALEEVAARMRFEIVQSPRHSADGTFAALADGARLHDAVAANELNIAAPTDDTPFFFHMLRLRDVFNTARWRDQGIVRFNMTAVGVLGVLLLTVIALTAVCILLPWFAAGSKDPALRAGAGTHLTYFAAIGFGFMLVEMSQVQRLTIFLGHPVYSLSVVLFALLVASGVGSFSTRGVVGQPRNARLRIVLLLAVLVIFGALTPYAMRQFASASTPVRIAISVLILGPLGFFMGMAFPIGMARAMREKPPLAPWLWGINGAASVCASVLAVVIALAAGISAAFWVGAACYAVALVSLRDRRA
jgi:hypothetical protein